MHAALSFRLWPYVRQLARIARDPLHVFRVCAAEAPIARLPFSAHPLRPCYQVSSPSLVQHVLATGASRYAKGRSLEPLQDLAGLGLLTSDGAHWERHRRGITPSLTAGHYERFARGTADLADRHLDALVPPEGEHEVDVGPPVLDLSLRVIVRALLDDDLPAFDQLRTVVQHLWDLVAQQAVTSSVLPWVPPLAWRRSFRESRRALDDLLGAIITQARHRPAGHGLVAHWMSPDDARAGGPLRDDELREEIATFLLAGHETVGATIVWALIQLALAPAVQEAVAREAAALPAPDRITEAHVEGLAFTRAVFLETMRLYPQPPILFRRAVADDDLGGLFIARGAELVVPTHVLHRDPSLWTEPDAFRPQRFLDGPAPPPEVFMPFGLGPRRCLGMRHAMLEGPMVLAMMVRRFVARPAVRPPSRYEGYEIKSSLRPRVSRLLLSRRSP